VREVLEQRRETGSVSDSHKKLVLKLLEQSESVEYTKETLKRMERGIEECIGDLERMTGKENWVLKFCLWQLKA
jgi:hypothetical protein